MGLARVLRAVPGFSGICLLHGQGYELCHGGAFSVAGGMARATVARGRADGRMGGRAPVRGRHALRAFAKPRRIPGAIDARPAAYLEADARSKGRRQRGARPLGGPGMRDSGGALRLWRGTPAGDSRPCDRAHARDGELLHPVAAGGARGGRRGVDGGRIRGHRRRAGA